MSALLQNRVLELELIAIIFFPSQKNSDCFLYISNKQLFALQASPRISLLVVVINYSKKTKSRKINAKQKPGMAAQNGNTMSCYSKGEKGFLI